MRLLIGLLALLSLSNAMAVDFIYTMRPGDNVWDISQKMLKNPGLWKKLEAYNGVNDALVMPPGKTLRIPAHWLKTEPAAAHVIALSGTVRLERPDETPRPLKISDMLKANDQIHIGADGSLALGFADDSRLQAGPQTVITLDRLTAFGIDGMVDTSIRLLEGNLESRVSKRQSPSLHFDIQTPVSLTSVRGTDYRVAFEGSAQTGRAEVAEGRVQVSNPLGAVAVPGGKGNLSRKGEAPSKPIPLLPAMTVTPLPARIEHLPPSMPLQAVTGAQGYEVQLSDAPGFERILAQRVFDKPRWSIPDLADGDYWLRIRAIDAHGLRGMDAVHAFTLAARPEPPLPLEPKSGGIIRSPVVSLKWSASEIAQRYHLTVSQDGNDHPLILDTILESTGHELKELAEGVYQWRVATIDASGKQGPFSDPQPFTVRHAPPPPGVEPPTADSESLELRWRAADGDVRYAYEFARDKDFTDVLARGETSTPSLVMPRPETGSYFMRIRVIDDPANPPPFGPAQKIEVPMDWTWLAPTGAMLLLILL